MQKVNLKFLIVVCIILGIAFGLRWKNYSTVPLIGESLDEYSTTWVGLSLIQLGVPVGGLGVGGYKDVEYKYVNPDRVYQSGIYNNPIEINKPWFDHPPLAPLISGGYAYVRGLRNFEDISLRIVRQPMVVLGVISVGLLIWLGSASFDKKTGLIAGLVYATVPLVVVTSRMVQIENYLSPLFLIAGLVLVYFNKYKDRRLLVLLGVLAGIAFWLKLSGIVVSITILAVLDNKYRKTVLAVFVPFVLAYLLYGFTVDAHTFINVFTANSSRFYGIGPQALFDIFSSSKVSNIRSLTDGWLIAGWMALLVIIGGDTKAKFIYIPVISFLAIYLLFGNYFYGWYLIPVWPWLFLAVARVVVGENLLLKILIPLVPFGVMVNKFIEIERFQNYASMWRWGIAGTLLGTIMVNKKRIVNLVVGIIFIAAITLNIRYVMMLDVAAWYGIF